MEETREKFNKLIIKVKNNRSLQVKVALVVGVLLLYHFLFGDIGNWNVKIESIVQKNAYQVDDRARDSLFSVSLENDELKINKFSKIKLEKKYCSNVDNYHKLRRVLSFEPIVVECDSMKDIFYEVVITDGKTFHKSGYSENRYSWSYPQEDKRGEYMYKDIDIKLPVKKNMSISAIEKKYCKEFELNLRKINTFDPMEVVCGYPDFARTRYYTNGKWMHIEKELDDHVVGQNEQYLLLGNYSLVDKRYGKITENNYIYRTSRYGINGIGAASENGRFFALGFSSSMDPTIDEINKVGEKTTLYTFNNYIFFKDAYIAALTSSHDGNYVFMLVRKTSRGPGPDLLFYIVDVRNKSLLYRKKLVTSNHGLRNIDISNISNHSDKIVFNYAVDGDVYAYKVVLKK